MSQLQPTIIEPEALPLTVVAPRRRGKLRLPGWLTLLTRNPKSLFGLALVGFMLVVAVIAPWISVAHPTDFNLLAARQAPSWNHLFGTTDQGSDIFSQVVLGARRSLILGAAAALLATALATVLGIFAAYSGGLVDEVVNFLTNVFLVIPTIPLLIVISAYLKSRGMTTMILVLGLTLWSFEARILRGQALTLKHRDFVQAARVAGEPDDLTRADRQVDAVDGAHVVVRDRKPAQLDERLAGGASHALRFVDRCRHDGRLAFRRRGFEISSMPASRNTSPTTVSTNASPGKKNGHHSPWSTVEFTCAQ